MLAKDNEKSERKKKIREKIVKVEMTNINTVSKSREIIRRLQNLFKFFNIKRDDMIHTFIPMEGKEPNLWPLFDEREMIIVPKVIENDKKNDDESDDQMQHFLFRSNRRCDLSKGKYGIFEPRDYLDQAGDEELKRIKAVLVPLLTFDKSGNRLGRGGGFYDRFLARMKRIGVEFVKIGVNFHPPIDSIPCEEHDIKLDWCITPYYSHSF